MRNTIILAIAAMALSPAYARADTHPLIDAEFTVLVGQFLADTSTSIRVDGTTNLPGFDIDINEQFDLGAFDNSIALEAQWRFGERWKVAAQYFRFSDSSAVVLEDDIRWGDLEFRAGVGIESTSALNVTRVFFGRDFLRTEDRAFGVGFGLHQLGIEMTVAGAAWVDDVLVADAEGRAEVSKPLPNIGSWFTWSPAEKWALRARLDWLSASIDPYHGSIINASAGVNYQFNRHIGVGLNYNLFELDVGVDHSGWRGEIDMLYHGPFVHVSAYW